MSQCEHIIKPGTPDETRCLRPNFTGLVAGRMWHSNYCSNHEPALAHARKVEHATQLKRSRKLEAQRAEAKKYIERGGIGALEIPAEIVKASEQVGAWFATQGANNWKLGPCASRRLCETHESDLVELIQMLRTIQDAVGGFST